MPPRVATLWRDATAEAPAMIFFRSGFEIEGATPAVPARIRPGMTLRDTVRVEFDRAPDGTLANCREAEHSGDFPMPTDFCTTLDEKYDVAPLGASKPRRGTSWMQIYSGSSLPAERPQGK